MAWIRTVPMEEADESVLKAMADQRALYPVEYSQPVQELDQGLPVSSPRTRSFRRRSIMPLPRSAPCCRPNCRWSDASTR